MKLKSNDLFHRMPKSQADSDRAVDRGLRVMAYVAIVGVIMMAFAQAFLWSPAAEARFMRMDTTLGGNK